MRQKAQVSVEIARPREQVFDAATDNRKLPRLMKKVGPIPGVTSVEMQGATDQPMAAGSRRRVTMSDGSIIGEEITVLSRPEAYAYRWLDRPAAPFNLLVRGAASDWKFSSAGGGTRIDWVYTFELTSALAYPLAWVATRLFRRWMIAAMAELKAVSEGAAR
jgi:uncharacterized protein YndB with AHSA1/START domain